jgi:hypothetical protein
MHPMVLLGDETQVEASFGPFGDSANLDARKLLGLRRTYTIGSEIVLDAPGGTPGDVGHVESHFGLFGDSGSVGAR